MQGLGEQIQIVIVWSKDYCVVDMWSLQFTLYCEICYSKEVLEFHGISPGQALPIHVISGQHEIVAKSPAFQHHLHFMNPLCVHAEELHTVHILHKHNWHVKMELCVVLLDTHRHIVSHQVFTGIWFLPYILMWSQFCYIFQSKHISQQSLQLCVLPNGFSLCI